jgi:Calcineurin-like phosphoesterase
MARFIFAGDSHGNTSYVSSICKFAEAAGIQTIYQLGDFGIWDHIPSGEYYLDTLNSSAEKRGVEWLFVAGNHENYDSLEEYEREAKAKQYPEYVNNGFIQIRDNITWVGRANVWYDQGVLFGALGGAVSIDRYSRKQGVSWWPQEYTNLNDLQAFTELVYAHGPLDVMISHDAPLTLPSWPGFIKDDPLSNANRAIMHEAGLAAAPTNWFHGHYHKELVYGLEAPRAYDPDHLVRIYGLDCDQQWNYGGCNVAIWDSETGVVDVAYIGSDKTIPDDLIV